MGKDLYIAEKPSVALEFARVLGVRGERRDGFVESQDAIVTWCVGHLITMSYPEAYDPALKRWSLNTIPFIPTEWKYEVIESVGKQFNIVKNLLNRPDVETIYVCTDSGREGEYIYRLVRQEAHVSGKRERRVWIDSQTEEEIRRGIREAKDLSAYDDLAASAYLRAKEDYLMGINFSRALTLKFGNTVADALHKQRAVISVGRVMTCVLGMVVRREREIRAFTASKFYRVAGLLDGFDAEWRAVEGTKYFGSPLLYKENGFKQRETAEELVRFLEEENPVEMTVLSNEKKTEQKRPPLLFNLAELQNECSKRFKKSPDETLGIVQELYEKKLVTYPRTDARVLSTAVAKEIGRNISGLTRFEPVKDFASEILAKKSHVGIERSMYTDDKKITDHYAIIPTGQGLNAFASLNPVAKQVYELICRRFLCIFFPNARYEKFALELSCRNEHFFANFRFLKDEGYLKVYQNARSAKAAEKAEIGANTGNEGKPSAEPSAEVDSDDTVLLERLEGIRKGAVLPVKGFEIREGETSAPKRYSSGTLILAMENAGQLIEDEELRAQIRSSGIGMSATRAEILKKLTAIEYLQINRKTQIVTPTLQGELVYDTVDASMRQLLNAELTASWEKGLSMVADGSITPDEYMEKMNGFVSRRTEAVKAIENPAAIRGRFEAVYPYYKR
ncbi:MAG: type IA DNA topoisomerase [Lachnospiraceae bacterium]|nr:type IA DNA topoisomerase [Lachnospiraceae bacterium]